MAQALGARLKSNETLGDRVIKVDHAGEHGAINIYTWQRAFAKWRCPELVPELDEFLAHERRHRALFEAELARRQKPRCHSFHLCGLGGAVLGVLTGVIGAKAIHATTEAVERVVLRHLQDQRGALRSVDPDVVSVIDAIIADEQQHHDNAANHLRGKRGLTEKVIDRFVAASTEAVIWLGMKL
ncbi:demethoxyubiquinone hydroxylase family protein [Erythrobacter sp. THAF29]|uniref:demethoxyubiquinone hydroxylase family protein n=1 Tax=Erythrobacter sp. THAF29 TaxID=2587851 RepID=UPI00126806F2|nr:demethoxyubiquinone hydroxylase family protein [Erythrobacter sp. THAF29]